MADKPKEASFECDICVLKFSSEQDLKRHLVTKKHRKREEYQNSTKCGVYIAGFPYNKSKEDALQYFSKFGGIQKSIIGPTMSYMIIVYETEAQATSVLSTEHFMDGRKLTVNRRQPQTFIHAENQDNDSHNKLIQQLGTVASFENQIKKFLQLMTPDSRQIWETYNLVNYDIRRALYGFVPHFNIYNFGSSTTALQFNSSDLDIYLDFGLQSNDVRRSLKLIKSGLSKSRLFYNIIDIPAAKVPIVRFVHSQTGMKGDINFVNKIGVENSKLIGYFLSLDHRLRSIVLVIKYWAKIREISGRNHLFTSYSMVMMFIFYLQQRHSFPSVYELQVSSRPSDPSVIWNMNIIPVRNMKKINKIHSVPVLDILKSFFEYYSNFDFTSRIICPYLAKTLDKKMFDDLETVPKEFFIYKNNLNNITPLDCSKPVCLQDPFEHNINTCKIIFDNILDRFVAGCFSAVKILSGEQRNMLVNLFTVEETVASPVKTRAKNGDDPDSYSITLSKPTVLNYLKSGSSDELTDMWFKHTLDYCHTVLEEILRLDLKPSENSKCARIGDQKNVHDCEVEKYHASCYVNVWGSRNINPEKNKELIKDCKTSLEKDVAISRSIWNENEEIRPSVPLFECNITLTCLKEPARINIEFSKISSYKKVYKCFGMYVKSKIPQWFLVHTKELNQESKGK